jgi:hypothetical protein
MFQICEVHITCDMKSSTMCQYLQSVGYLGIIIHFTQEEIYDIVRLIDEALEQSAWTYDKDKYCCQFCEVSVYV